MTLIASPRKANDAADTMNDQNHSDIGRIRKQVGTPRAKRPLELAWELRQRVLALSGGRWPEDDDHERIRKVVGRTKPRSD